MFSIRHNLICLSVVAMLGVGHASFAKEVKNELDLSDAITMALEKSPRIKSAASGVLAAKGERRQAVAFPNPTLGVDAENLGGTGSFKGVDAAEITFGVSQLVEIGGKRSARIGIAEASQDMAGYNQLATKLDLVRDVKVAFANAVASQEQTVIAEQQVMLAKDVLSTVTKRVNAAAEPLIQKNKARVSLANAQVAYEKAKRQKTATLKNLFNLWGASSSNVALSKKQFYSVEKPVSHEAIENALTNTVDHKRQLASVNQAKSFLDLEKANAVPDPSFNVGVRELRENNDQAFVVGVSMPLPVFNINGGNIAKARAEAVKADTDRQNLLLEKQDQFNDYTQGLESSYTAASMMKRDILPQAEEAFRQAKQGYNAGKFAYLEVLDAQRTLAETKQAYVEALQQYQINNAEIERLLAQAEGSNMEKTNEK